MKHKWTRAQRAKYAATIQAKRANAQIASPPIDAPLPLSRAEHLQIKYEMSRDENLFFRRLITELFTQLLQRQVTHDR